MALAAVAALLVVHPPHYALSTHALVALAALAAYVAWIGASRSWSAAPVTALEDFDRGLVYIGLFALALIAAGSGRLARLLVWAVLAALVAVASGALVSRLHPDLITTPATGLVTDPYRLAYPFGYWNALGAWAAMGIVLAVGLAADRSAHAVARGFAAAGGMVLGCALYLSLSRGAWAALAAGAIVLTLFAPHRRAYLVSLAIVGGTLAIAIGVLAAEPALVDDPAAGSGQEAAGDAVWPTLALLAAAAAVAQGLLATARVPRALRPVERGLRRRGRRAAPFVAGALLLALVIGYAVETDRVEGHAAEAVVDVRETAERHWRDFLAPSSFSAEGRDRLTSTRGTRSDLYRVAIDGFEAEPLRGEGAGAFEYRWIRERDVTEKVRDVHSLYLETLSELGLVGAVLLIAFLATVGFAALRSRLHPRAISRSECAGVTAACVVWAVHAAVDWDWQVPALTGAALVLSAALFPYGRRSEVSGRSRPSAPAG